MEREYIKGVYDKDFKFDTKVWWCVNHHKEVIKVFPKGITITMFIKGMRKEGLRNGRVYGYSWTNGWLLMRNGIFTVKKAKEVSDMLFNEYKVFVPYLELMGFMDVVTMPDGWEV